MKSPETEPFFVAQTFELDLEASAECGRIWIEDQATKARNEGATWFRCTVSDSRDGLLIEGWKNRPENEGEPRWQLMPERVPA
jgi:hypothetical protein